MNEIEPQTLEQQTCSSDMLCALMNLERMFHTYRFCLNEYAANAVLLGMAVEAQTLALKMKAMLARWKKYLPFHEVMDVKFDHWEKAVSEWIEVLGGNPSEEVDYKYPWMEGRDEYMLDLFALTECIDEEGRPMVRAPEFYEVGIKDDYQREMAAYIERMDELILDMQEDEMEDIDGWRTDVARMSADSLRDAFISDVTMPYFYERDKQVVENLEQYIRERFDTLVNFDDTIECALIALRCLQNQLCDVQALFCKHLPNEMFIRLSTRLFYRHCLNSYREGEACVNKWRNNWPEAKLKKNSEKKKEELIKLLAAKSYGLELQEYITLSSPNLFGDSSFGKFLFKNRQELKVEDVQYIHKVCRELNLLNELIGEEGREVHNLAPIRQLDAQEQEILQKVELLVKKARWENITEESVITAIHKALGVGPVFADTKLVAMSQSLWELLKKRRGCDAEKSLMVTWLNIVGYCVKKGFLSGGSPALTKRFFPRCGNDDYKAIDKGRHAENNKNFQSILPLLDVCFKGGRWE